MWRVIHSRGKPRKQRKVIIVIGHVAGLNFELVLNRTASSYHASFRAHLRCSDRGPKCKSTFMESFQNSRKEAYNDKETSRNKSTQFPAIITRLGCTDLEDHPSSRRRTTGCKHTLAHSTSRRWFLSSGRAQCRQVCFNSLDSRAAWRVHAPGRAFLLSSGHIFALVCLRPLSLQRRGAKSCVP